MESGLRAVALYGDSPYRCVYSSMKAIRIHSFGGPDVMAFESIPDFTAGPGEVLVKVQAIGVNPVDTYIRAGLYGDRVFPYTPGMDASGTVLAVGGAVARFKVNDRVYVA